MTLRRLFLLAVDHRRSFEKLFGIDGAPDSADVARLTAAKGLVAEALGDVAAHRRTSGSVGAGAEIGVVGAGADIGVIGDLGILVDDLYGSAAIDVARRSGVAVALAFERSGLPVLELEHDDWRQRLAADPPTYVKVLIRHRADGDSAEIATQLDRLREISDACAASSARFLLELLTPYDAQERAAASDEELEVNVRPGLVVAAIEQIQDAGVDVDVWKVEGVADVTGCAAIASAARRDGRDDTGVVVLGAGAGVDTVDRWLQAAADGGYTGFAVGRSIWADAVLAHDRRELDDADARARIAGRYDGFIDTFLAAAAS